MADYVVNDTDLTSVADAIRTKGGTSEQLSFPDGFVSAVNAISGGSSGPSIPDSAFVLSGDCAYWDYNGKWDTFIEAYSDKWSTSNISSAIYMFYNSKLDNIPFDLNFGINIDINASNMFRNCKYITQIPKLKNLRAMALSYVFYECNLLRTIPENCISNWDWGCLDNSTSSFFGEQSNMFSYCYSLRSIPIDLISHGNPYVYGSYSYFSYGFVRCQALDELINLFIPSKTTWTSNVFNATFDNCNRLKNITFAKQEDGTPYAVKWKNQNINLSNNVGYAIEKSYILNYNSGITADKEVTDDTTYAALKDDPDWFTCNIAYSRYNHDSAVATINSLPDTSAYLATAGGTNTIKFKGAAGSATDGGAINTLTEEEIAVATAKGWTVTLV